MAPAELSPEIQPICAFWGGGFKQAGIFREEDSRKPEFCLQTSLNLDWSGRP